MNRRKFLLLSAAGLSSGCAQFTDTPNRSGLQTQQSSPQPGSTEQVLEGDQYDQWNPTERWRYPTSYTHDIVTDADVFLGGSDFTTALSPSGELNWEKSGASYALAIQSDTLFSWVVGENSDHLIRASAMATGSTRWTRWLDGKSQIDKGPAISSELVVFATKKGLSAEETAKPAIKIQAHDASTGEHQWSIEFENPTSDDTIREIVIAGDLIYVQTYADSIYAIELDGSIRWTTAHEQNISEITVSQTGSISYSKDGAVIVRDSSGAERELIRGMERPIPDIVDESLFLREKNVITRAERTTGSLLWQRELPDTAELTNVLISEPIVSEDIVYVLARKRTDGEDDSVIYALTLSDGSVIGSYNLGNAEPRVSPAALSDAIVAPHESGIVSLSKPP